MAFAYASHVAILELRRRRDYADVCVPPSRPDLRPEPPAEAPSVLVHVWRALRGGFRPLRADPWPAAAGR